MKTKHFVLALLAATSTLLTVAQEKKDVTLEEVWQKYAFRTRGVEGFSPLADGAHYSIFNSDESGWFLEKVSFATGEPVGRLVSAGDLAELYSEMSEEDFPEPQDYVFNKSENVLVMTVGAEPLYRHSFQADYYVYHLTENKLWRVSDQKVRYATASPDGSKLAYVLNNNLYVKNLITGEEKAVTTDGKEDAIINGAVDWVYEEEFSFSVGFQWSPDGKYLAYYRFDESQVPQFSMDIFNQQLYPTQDAFKYPKAGEVNSVVTLHIWRAKDQTTAQVDLGTEYEYIPRIQWSTLEGLLTVQTLNRHQNELKFIGVDATVRKGRVMFTEKDEAYLEINDNLTFLKDGSFIWTSDQDGYMHLYQKSATGSIIRQITKGPWDVTHFYGVDNAGKTLFFSSSEAGAHQQQLYSIAITGGSKRALTSEPGWHDADFNPQMTYFLETYSSAAIPPRYVLRDAKGKEVRKLQDNDFLLDRLKDYSISPKEFFTITANGQTLNAWQIKPKNFDPGKKYPVLMFVYGGPGAQTVQDEWDSFNFFWYQHLASKGYMVVSVDNRGTGARGKAFRKATYKQLGKLETEDQIAAAKYLANQPYVDGSRIGIWGWSYGGYMSSLCITKGADVFKMAMAVAPVTNWRYYDNIYTERYMQTPQENAKGYDENSPINHVDKLKGKYLLVHGSADDNVHYQNSMEMVRALVAANKTFDLMIYPDKNHGIYGGNTRMHLYQLLTNYVEKNL
jgi:dipeptidyl-peptidase-4